MAYLNEQERDALLQDLITMRFNQAKGKLRRMDPKARLVLHRTVESTGEWYTQYDLIGLGTRVILIENRAPLSRDTRKHEVAQYEMAKVIVEPLPENRT